MDVTHIGLGALLIAFGGGLVSFFSPCVAPLVPGYISYLAGIATRRQTAGDAPDGTLATVDGAGAGATRLRLSGATVPASLLFVGGFSAAFVALGLLAGGFGGLLAAYRPVLETLAGIVMLVMGVFLLELLPAAWTFTLLREARIHLSERATRRLGRLAPFALGVVFAAGWTPCIGPVLASILAFAGAAGNSGSSALLLACYACGFAVPFLAIGFGWSAGLGALGWAKRHTRAISMASGVALALLGVVYLTGQAQTFATWAQQAPLR